MGFLRKLLDSFGKDADQAELKAEAKTETEVAQIQTEYQKSEYPFQDKRKAVCPYCEGILKKIPGSKTKCPHCKKEMFVRTNTKNIKMVVTEEEVEKIEEEWAIVSGRHDIYLEEKKRFKDEEQKLAKRFGSKPSENDVKWSLLNQKVIENFQKMNFFSQRVTRYQMGDILRKEKKLNLAMEAYFEVCYLDLNGSNDIGRFLPYPDMLKDSPAFDPQKGFLAQELIDFIRRMMKKLNFDKGATKELFLKTANPIYKSFKPPLSPEDCWVAIWSDLEKAK